MLPDRDYVKNLIQDGEMARLMYVRLALLVILRIKTDSKHDEAMRNSPNMDFVKIGQQFELF